MHQVMDRSSVREGDRLWTCSPEQVERARLTAATRFAEDRICRPFRDCTAVCQWSTSAAAA